MDPMEIKKTAHQEYEKDIQELKSNFYELSFNYLKEIKNKMNYINNKNSIEYKILNDELLSLTEDIYLVFMKRIGKIVKRSLSEAFTSIQSNLFKKEYDKLLPLEKNLYDNIINDIKKLQYEYIDSY